MRLVLLFVAFALLASTHKASASDSNTWLVGQKETNGRLTCSVSLTNGALPLTLEAGGSPPFVQVIFGGELYRFRSPGSIDATFTFDRQPSVRLHGYTSGGRAFLPLNEGSLATWLHGYTGASKMLVTITGEDQLSTSLFLTGTTSTINTMLNCIQNKAIVGLPRPFQIGPVVSAGKAAPASPPEPQIAPTPPQPQAMTWYYVSNQDNRCTTDNLNPADLIANYHRLRIPYRVEDVKDSIDASIIEVDFFFQEGLVSKVIKFYRTHELCLESQEVDVSRYR